MINYRVFYEISKLDLFFVGIAQITGVTYAMNIRAERQLIMCPNIYLNRFLF